MCGIIGYVGKKPAVDIIKDALKRLEYRGYDSAGIATIANGSVHLCKDKGNVADVIKDCTISNLPGYRGIGHVRWATHGGVTRENAHPHCDSLSQIAVIHNGIIENYEQLKKHLVQKYKFKSETDTEVIPHLIREQIDAGMSFEEAFFTAIRQLEGSFAIIAYPRWQTGNCSPRGKTARWFSVLVKTRIISAAMSCHFYLILARLFTSKITSVS